MKSIHGRTGSLNHEIGFALNYSASPRLRGLVRFPFYSVLIARTGSMVAARRAGSNAETSAVMSKVTPTRESGQITR